MSESKCRTEPVPDAPLTRPCHFFRHAALMPVFFLLLSGALPGILHTPFHSPLHAAELSSAHEKLSERLRQVAELEDRYGPFDYRLAEALQALAMVLEEDGQLDQARESWKRAIHVLRINEGLYTRSQFRLLENLIGCDIARSDWAAVDDSYRYLEHLYLRLYEMDDPELEAGLREVSDWHMNALTLDLDGRRMEHLEQANKLMRLRLKIAQQTLSPDDPRLDQLENSVAMTDSGPKPAPGDEQAFSRASRQTEEDREGDRHSHAEAAGASEESE